LAHTIAVTRDFGAPYLQIECPAGKLLVMQQFGRSWLALAALMLASTQLAVAQPQPTGDRQLRNGAASDTPALATQSSAVQNQTSLTPQKEQTEDRTYKVAIASLPVERVAYVSVGVNSAIGIAALLALISVRRQAKASEQSAKAAFASAEAVLNGERAWIQIRPYATAQNVQCHEASSTKTKKASPLSIVNVGKTPARIMSISGSYLVLNRLGELPVQPTYEQRDDFRGMILAPQESIGHMVEGLEPGEILIDDLIHKRAVAFIHARVLYKDVFGNEHETREGFHFDPDSAFAGGKLRLVKAGPPAYHAST
jgi:hypothetical protein